LEAALFRPQTGYYEDIVAEAAALIESLAINHPFVDGNKRIAFAAADVFLRIDGWRLQRAPMQIYAEMMRMFESRDVRHRSPRPMVARLCHGRRGIMTHVCITERSWAEFSVPVPYREGVVKLTGCPFRNS
jgi:fido (protein-threonine AMPylation protein)